MTYYGAKELADAFRTGRKNTLVVAEEIPEDQYSFRATPETRSVAELLSHIALSSKFQTYFHQEVKANTTVGFDFMAFFTKLTKEMETPRSKSEIIALLKAYEESVGRCLATP